MYFSMKTHINWVSCIIYTWHWLHCKRLENQTQIIILIADTWVPRTIMVAAQINKIQPCGNGSAQWADGIIAIVRNCIPNQTLTADTR